MTRDDLLLLFDYNYWATERLLNAVGKLSAEQYAETVAGLSMGSIRNTLVHMLAAERIWRLRCLEGQSPTQLLRWEDLPALDLLRSVWVEEEEAMRAGLARLTDGMLAGRLAYRTTDGQPKEEILWQLLVQVVNHGTQHRAEAAVALTAFGFSPGDVDFIVFLRLKA